MNTCVYVLLCIFLTSGGQVLLKKGSVTSKDHLRAYFNKYSLFGYGLLLLATLFSTLALQYMELKTFYSLMAANFILVMILSMIALKEKPGKNKIIGTILIVLGLVVFNL